MTKFKSLKFVCYRPNDKKLDQTNHNAYFVPTYMHNDYKKIIDDYMETRLLDATDKQKTMIAKKLEIIVNKRRFNTKSIWFWLETEE